MKKITSDISSQQFSNSFFRRLLVDVVLQLIRRCEEDSRMWTGPECEGTFVILLLLSLSGLAGNLTARQDQDSICK
ncbi:hypothetical protein O3M35_003492 [Rhynocoris fuscipes]|uniref:Uncharacterized protein n=1 Tax=Rhynocoris fuscipes TaxID=488301 RepID=A0AAW1CN53_9HEMI